VTDPALAPGRPEPGATAGQPAGAQGDAAAAQEGQAGRRLGKTTGWIHRTTLKMKQVEMIAGVNYERITDEGLLVTYGDKHEDATWIGCDTVVLCAGQVPQRELADALQALGKTALLIGGAFEAGELDAKRAIDQAARLAARL
jgi:2,4-dienoyl-CoA reductase (NADPH2)